MTQTFTIQIGNLPKLQKLVNRINKRAEKNGVSGVAVTVLENTKRRSTASFFNGSRPQYSRRMHCIQGSDAHRITGSGKNLGVGKPKE